MVLSAIHAAWQRWWNHWHDSPNQSLHLIDRLTSTARAASSWIGHLVHTRQLGTVRRCTFDLACLQTQISTETLESYEWCQAIRWGVTPDRCTWSSGLSSGSKSAHHWIPVRPLYTLFTRTDQRKQQLHSNQYEGLVLKITELTSTCTLGTALSWLGNRPETRCLWADEGHAGDCASSTCAVLAGVGRCGEGVAVGVDNPLIQTGVTHRATGVWRDWIWTLNWTRSLLAVHHFILIRGRMKEGWTWSNRAKWTIWYWIFTFFYSLSDWPDRSMMSRGKKVKQRWSQRDILFPDSGKCLYSGGSTPREGSPDSHRRHSDTTCVNTPHCHSVPQKWKHMCIFGSC